MKKKEPLEFASVGFEGTNWGTSTNEEGKFSITINQTGTYKLIVSSVGYDKLEKEITFSPSQTQINLGTIEITSKQDVLEEVVVSDNSVATEIAEQPITINTIDTKLLQGETKDVARLLDQAQGVRIRQGGGLGSSTSITLNGLTGNAVRFYYNGIPIEFLGQGFNLNTIPISNVARIDIYKGVMPANIGTDALGGGINVVTNQNPENNFDVSYQYGSFNTHRIAATITRKFAGNWYFNLSANYNYSDNDYEMNVTNNIYGTLPNSSIGGVIGRENIRVGRFHDAFSALLVQTGIGYFDEDRKLYFRAGINVTMGYKEFQQGARVGTIPLGEVTYREQGTNFTFDISKGFGENWQISYLGNIGYSRLITDDSTNVIYDWNGNNITAQFPNITTVAGAELLANPSRSDIYNYNTVHRLGIIREFEYGFKLSLNHFLAYQDRSGTEELEASYIAGTDPNTIGFQLTKNISAFELSKSFLEDKIELLTTAKYYQYSARGVDIRLVNASELPTVNSEDAFWGYNFAGKWNINENIFIRASFEEAVRIPDQIELFGDLRTIAPNFALRPERSQNVNVGFNLAFREFLKIDFNYFLRNQTDLIFIDVSNISLGTYRNRDDASATGFETSLSGEPFKNFTYTWNTTYQEIKINGFTDIRDEFLVGNPIPNIPTFFTNLALTYTLEDFLKEGNSLKFNTDIYFIDEFSFIQEGGQRNDDNWIPTQNAMDFGLSYIWDNKLSFNFQINNLFDAELFDFISVPRPGRNFAFKIRYNIN